jgi:hypothetical protein
MPKLPMKADPLGFRYPMPETFQIENPLVVMFIGPDKSVVTHIHPASGYTHRSYGLLIADLVQHVARAYKVPEGAVWEWVDKERANPTTTVINPS